MTIYILRGNETSSPLTRHLECRIFPYNSMSFEWSTLRTYVVDKRCWSTIGNLRYLLMVLCSCRVYCIEACLFLVPFIVVVIVLTTCCCILRFQGPYVIVLSIPLRSGVLITRLRVGIGIWVTEIITRTNNITLRLDVYSDTLVVDRMGYPTLEVVRLSV